MSKSATRSRPPETPAQEPLPGFRIISPVVFAGIYPVDSSDFETAPRRSCVNLQLNDSALHVEQESSMALGFGFRCGFLGLLHLEIVFERLQRNFNLDIITTAPSVIYKFTLTDGQEKSTLTMWPTIPILRISNFVRRALGQMPHHGPCRISRSYHEPWHGQTRGAGIKQKRWMRQRLLLTYRFPLNEIITDFNDKLKSVTRGYGSFDYEFD